MPSRLPMHPVVAITLLLMLSALGWGSSPGAMTEISGDLALIAIPALFLRGLFLLMGDASRIGRGRK